MRIVVRDKKQNADHDIQMHPDEPLLGLRNQLAAQKNVAPELLRLYFQDELILDMELTPKHWGMADGSVLSLVVIGDAYQPDPTVLQAQTLIQRAHKNPDYLSKVMDKDPVFGELLVAENFNNVANYLRQKQGTNGQATQVQRPVQPPQPFQFRPNPPATPQQIQNPILNNPANYNFGGNNMYFDVNAQKRIEEHIRQNRLNQLQQNAYDNYPELFIQTQMLFITGKVNKISTEIFVDTGAQVTIISKAFAERSGIIKDLDTRYKAHVQGVGSQTSLGKVFLVEMMIGNRMFLLSANVLEKFSHDVLLGLDMMKRHRCVIDLAQNEIKFGTEQVVAKFMTDHEISQVKERQNAETIERLQQMTGVNTGEALRLLEQNHFDAEKAVEQHQMEKGGRK